MRCSSFRDQSKIVVRCSSLSDGTSFFFFDAFGRALLLWIELDRDQSIIYLLLSMGPLRSNEQLRPTRDRD